MGMSNFLTTSRMELAQAWNYKLEVESENLSFKRMPKLRNKTEIAKSKTILFVHLYRRAKMFIKF